MFSKLRARPSKQKRTWAFRVLLATCFLVVLALFLIVLTRQSETFDANSVRQRLIETGDIRALERWTVDFRDCIARPGGRRECVEAGSHALAFPFRGEAIKGFVEAAENETVAVARHALTSDERAWLERQDHVAIVIPRNVQIVTRMSTQSGRSESRGMGADTTFTVRAAEVLAAGEVTLEFEFTGLPFFGPTDLPIVLAVPAQAPLYASLPTRQLAANNLVTQLGIAFRLNIAAMALVLDHSRTFGLLSLYGVARALRAFVPFLVESGMAFSPTLAFVHFANCGITFAALLLFVLEICGFGVRSLWKGAASIGAAAAVFTLWGRLDPNGWLRMDLYSDALACLVAVPIVLASITKAVQERRLRPQVTGTGAQFAFSESFAWVSARKVLLLAALMLHGSVNAFDLFETFDGAFKSVLDWKHSVLFPAITLAALFEVGFTSKKVNALAGELVEKALLDKELETARAYQQRILPPRRRETELYAWRASYLPASHLAGDWFDVRELAFVDGRKLLAVVVADVTGHGVEASLTTTVISAYWGQWCEESRMDLAPLSPEEKGAFLSGAPRRIHAGLTAGREGGTCTALFALLDRESGDVTICCAGHPFGVASDGQRMIILNAPSGGGLGATRDDRPWESRTYPITSADSVYLYTDGLFPPELSPSMFFSRLGREMKKTPVPVMARLLKRLRETRRLYRVQREHEDDMTLVVVRFAGAGVDKLDLP